MSQSTWSITDAKSKLSEVLNRADQGVQFIRRRGHDYAVLSAEQYAKMTGQKPDFLEHLIERGPKLEEGLEPIPRDQSEMRDLEL